MKVLIVEDSRRVRELIRRLLGGLSDEIYECADGSDAFAAYDEHLPDWVLMDIEMKRMDGLSASRLIKDAHPEARIVIVTRYDDEKLREAARNAGACDYVPKENLLELRRILASPPATEK
ncbi:MAG: response regulator transcription factor [Acidobacteriota bacterium]